MLKPMGQYPGEGNGNPLQCSYLENSMEGGAWWTSPWGCEESDMTEGATCGTAPGSRRWSASPPRGQCLRMGPRPHADAG